MTGMSIYLYYEGPNAQLIISICVCSFVCYVHFFFLFFLFCRVAAMLPFVNNVNKHYSIDYYCFSVFSVLSVTCGKYLLHSSAYQCPVVLHTVLQMTV